MPPLYTNVTTRQPCLQVDSTLPLTARSGPYPGAPGAECGRQRRLACGIQNSTRGGRVGSGMRATAREISEQQRGARSPLHQTPSKTRVRVCLVQNSLGDITGLRSNEPIEGRGTYRG